MVVSKPIKLRSGQTNNPRKIPGVDGRSSSARRYRDILTGLSVEFLGVDPAALREIAGLRLTAEICAADAILGNRKARSDLVRCSNLAAKRERELRIKLNSEPLSTSIADPEALPVKCRQETHQDCSTLPASLSSLET